MVCHKYSARTTDPVMGTDSTTFLLRHLVRPAGGFAWNTTSGLSFLSWRLYSLWAWGAPGVRCLHRTAARSLGLCRHRFALWRHAGLGSYVAAYEVDGCELAWENGLPSPTGRDGTPKAMTILATGPAHLLSNLPDNQEGIIPLSYDLNGIGDLEYTATILLGDAAAEKCAQFAHGNAVMGLFEKGGTVFNAGSADWAYGLDSDPQVQRITKNVLTHLSS